MNQSESILYIIKLVLGGITAFLAIMLWSKTRDIAWVSLIAGTITAYAGVVYDMLARLGIIPNKGIVGFPLTDSSIAVFLFTIIPSLFYIVAFFLMLLRTRR